MHGKIQIPRRLIYGELASGIRNRRLLLKNLKVIAFIHIGHGCSCLFRKVALSQVKEAGHYSCHIYVY